MERDQGTTKPEPEKRSDQARVAERWDEAGLGLVLVDLLELCPALRAGGHRSGTGIFWFCQEACPPGQEWG